MPFFVGHSRKPQLQNYTNCIDVAPCNLLPKQRETDTKNQCARSGALVFFVSLCVPSEPLRGKTSPGRADMRAGQSPPASPSGNSCHSTTMSKTRSNSANNRNTNKVRKTRTKNFPDIPHEFRISNHKITSSTFHISAAKLTRAEALKYNRN